MWHSVCISVSPHNFSPVDKQTDENGLKERRVSKYRYNVNLFCARGIPLIVLDCNDSHVLSTLRGLKISVMLVHSTNYSTFDYVGLFCSKGLCLTNEWIRAVKWLAHGSDQKLAGQSVVARSYPQVVRTDCLISNVSFTIIFGFKWKRLEYAQ